MASNKALELSIKIAGRVDKSLDAAIRTTDKKVGSLAKSVSRIGTIGVAAMGSLATGAIAAINSCTKEAETFEKNMADVVKYVSGLADENGKISNKIADNGKTFAKNYETAKDAIMDLSTQIPYTTEELTKLAAAAGQSGYTMDELFSYDKQGNVQGFLKDVAMWGTAMDISAEQAGDWAAKWERALSTPTAPISHDDIMEYADMINYLGATTPTTAAEIAGVVNEIAGLGSVAGANFPTLIAMADAVLSVGVNEGKAATGLKRMMTNMTLGTSATKAQRDAWAMLGTDAETVAKGMQQNAADTMISVMESINELEDWQKTGVLKSIFGQWAIEPAAKMTQNLQPYINALKAVSDPSTYTGSMEREFVIKSNTSDAIAMMQKSSLSAIKITAGDTFLPVKKQFNLMLIDILTSMRKNMPELKETAQTLAEILSKGVSKLGEALEKAMPHIRDALNYVNEHGDNVASTLKKIAGVLVGMKLAPAAEALIRGTAGIVGGAGKFVGKTAGSLFTGGVRNAGKAGSAVGGAAKAMSLGASLAGSSVTRVSGDAITNTGLSAKLHGASNGILGAIFGFKNRKALGNDKSSDKTMLKNVLSTASQISAAKENGGLLGMAKSKITGSGIAQYLGGIKTAGARVKATSIGGGLLKGAKATGGTVMQVLKNIAGPEGLGLTNLLSGAKNLAGAGMQKVSGAMSMIKYSKAGQAVSGVAGKVAPMAGHALSAGKGALGAVGKFGGSLFGMGKAAITPIWKPAIAGFGKLFAGAAPIVGVISSIIAVVSILGDHIEGIRGVIGDTFGDKGLAVFDGFIGVIENVKNAITGLFQDGAVANALQPVHDAIQNMFGEDAGNAFSGLTTILQSVMGVIGQVVDFAETTVKPIIENIYHFIVDTVMPIILQTFSEAAPIIGGILSTLGTAVMNVMQFIGTAIQTVMPYVQKIITVILHIGQVVVPALLNGIQTFAGGIATLIDNIKSIFSGLTTFLSGVFYGNWSKAWEGIKGIVKGAFESLVTLVKTPFNAVISLINGVLDKIDGMHLHIPDWVPILGGKDFSPNIPRIPMLAKGGFTNGASIAGEAGTEAVISFQRAVRKDNIKTWAKAGQMLGIGGNEKELREINTSGSESGAGYSTGVNITFAPNITIQGNADRAMVEQVLEEQRDKFAEWFMDMQQRAARTAY